MLVHYNGYLLQEEYRKEKIQWNVISFVDNQECLDLICKPPCGIVHILGDESNFPQVLSFS